MTDNRTLPSQIRSRKRHQYREAENTLKYIIEQIEAGYDFHDEFGPKLLDEMRKICGFLRKEYDDLTAAPETPGSGSASGPKDADRGIDRGRDRGTGGNPPDDPGKPV